MPPPSGELSAGEYAELLQALEMTRACEERLEAMRAERQIAAPVYRSLGQEAGPVGCAHALRRAEDGTGDLIAPSVRCAGALFTMGLTPLEYFRHFCGAESGPAGGRDADLQFSDFARGWIGSVSPLGTMVSVMAGVALAFRLRGESRVAMVFCGDGATSTGAWHEGLAFAAALRCPLVLVVEANRWALSTPTRNQSRLHSFAAKADGYGIVGKSVDGNDVLAVRQAAAEAVSAARGGEGVRLLELRTYRAAGHSDEDSQEYVPIHEHEEWAQRDPLVRYRKWLADQRIASGDQLDSIREGARLAADEAAEVALKDDEPVAETALCGVYGGWDSLPPWTRGTNPVPKSTEG